MDHFCNVAVFYGFTAPCSVFRFILAPRPQTTVHTEREHQHDTSHNQLSICEFPGTLCAWEMGRSRRQTLVFILSLCILSIHCFSRFPAPDETAPWSKSQLTVPACHPARRVLTADVIHCVWRMNGPKPWSAACHTVRWPVPKVSHLAPHLAGIVTISLGEL